MFLTLDYRPCRLLKSENGGAVHRESGIFVTISFATIRKSSTRKKTHTSELVFT